MRGVRATEISTAVRAVLAHSGNKVTVAYHWTPFASSYREVIEVPTGKTLRELAPQTGLPVVCLLDGEPVMRADWEYVPQPEDHVVFQMLVQGGGGGSNPLRVILTIAVIVVAAVVAPYVAGPLVGALGEGGAIMFAQAALTAIGGILVNALLPPSGPKPLSDVGQTDSPSSVYSVNLNGNQAKLGNVIPVIYGRHMIFPDFAAQPYTEYDNTGEDANGDPANDQYYYALFCIGQGYYDIEKELLDDTILDHFEGVETHKVEPGGALTLVNPAVVGAVEVSGQELLQGEYVGPFTVVAAGLTVDQIGIDIIFPRGLYYAEDDGELSEKTCRWLVEARRVDDEGNPTSFWSLLGYEEYTDSRSVAIRKTYNYTVPSGRYEVRAQRQDVRDDNNRAGHDIQWAAMRGFLDIPVPLHANATYYEVRMKSNEQLNGMSQRRFALLVQRKIHTWSTADGWSATRVATSSIAWAIADILRDTNYGARLPDNRIDLTTLEYLDGVWAARKDYFNYVFDSRVTVWDAVATAARCGRTARFMRGGVMTFTRDEAQTVPVALFTPRNMGRNSLNLEYLIPTEDTADALEVSYFDENTWSLQYFTVNDTGVTDPQNIAEWSLPGATSQKQAEREARYTLAAARFRRKTVKFTTELDGMIPTFGDLIAISHDVAQWGSASGEVVAWDATTNIIQLSEPVIFTQGSEGEGGHYIAFAESDGTYRGPYQVLSDGVSDYGLEILDPDEDMGFINTTLMAERTRFTFGPSVNFMKEARVIAVRPTDTHTIEITAVIEDQRVHDADLAVPPDGGAGGEGVVYAPDSIPEYDSSSTAQKAHYGYYAADDAKLGAANDDAKVYQ